MVSKMVTRKTFFHTMSIITVCMLMMAFHVVAETTSPQTSNPTISKLEVRNTSSGDEVWIVADTGFTHSAFMLSDPQRIVLDIPNAELGVAEPVLSGRYTYLDTITSRKIEDGDGGQVVRIELVLKKDVPYQINPMGNSLKITFGNVDSHEVIPAAEIPNETPRTSKMTEAQKVYGLVEPTKYKGKPIFLDLKDADILDIFRLIADVSGFNVVVDPDVSGRITIRMDNVPWDQALEVILKNQGLDKEIEGNVMRIASTQKLRDEHHLKAELAHQKELAVPLQTMILYLSYADIDDMMDMMQGFMSQRGVIKKDERINALVVMDVPAVVANITELVKILDVRTKQVALNAQIVVTTKSFSRNLGIAWGGKFVADAEHGNTTGYRFPNNYTVDFGENMHGNTHPGWEGDGSGYAVNLPSGDTLLALTFGNIMDTLKLNMALTASELEGFSKTIARPRVTTINNEEATVASGDQIPYATTSDAGTKTEWKSATTSLTVTPHITNDNWISMDVEATRDYPEGNQGNIKTNNANSKVLVKNGDTLVIGGLNTSLYSNDSDQIPWLSKIPVMGWLFKNSAKRSKFSDLLFFITPQILEEGEQVIRTEAF